MGTNIDIIANNNIVFPTVRNLFTNGCILPYNDILTDINITMNDDTCMMRQHETFTNPRPQADITPIPLHKCIFYLYRTFPLFFVSVDKQDRKSTRLNSSHSGESRMPSSA